MAKSGRLNDSKKDESAGHAPLGDTTPTLKSFAKGTVKLVPFLTCGAGLSPSLPSQRETSGSFLRGSGSFRPSQGYVPRALCVLNVRVFRSPGAQTRRRIL